MKTGNHKLHKPILTLALFATCAVFALFAINGKGETPVFSANAENTASPISNNLPKTMPLAEEPDGEDDGTAENDKYPYLVLSDDRSKDDIVIKDHTFEHTLGVLREQKNTDGFNIGVPDSNYYYNTVTNGWTEDKVQPAHTMEMDVYVNDYENMEFAAAGGYVNFSGAPLDLFRDVNINVLVSAVHIYDYEQSTSIENIIAVQEKKDKHVINKLYPLNEKGFFLVNTWSSGENAGHYDYGRFTTNGLQIILNETNKEELKKWIGKKIAIDIFAINNVKNKDNEYIQNNIITEPNVYVRYLYTIKSGSKFMEELKTKPIERTVYAPDNMYFQMRLKHPARDYLFKINNNQQVTRCTQNGFSSSDGLNPRMLILETFKDGKEISPSPFFIKDNFLQFNDNAFSSKEGTYTVKLYNNHWFSEELCLATWKIVFLPLTKAGMLKQKELEKNLTAEERFLSPDELEALVDKGKAKRLNHISFGRDPNGPLNDKGGLDRWNIYSRFFFVKNDENFSNKLGELYNTTDNTLDISNRSIENTVYPYPILPFEQCAYGWMEKDENYDYQSYRIVQNTNGVNYKSYLSDKNQNLIPGGKIIYDHNAYTYTYKSIGKGKYDYENVKIKENFPSGFMYINAAGSPGQMLRLEGQDIQLTKGERIYVSMWVNELTADPTTANIGISVKAYQEGDNIENEDSGIELANYLSGFVPKWQGEDTHENLRNNTFQHPIYNPQGLYQKEATGVERCRGNWMNIGFSFVPDLPEGWDLNKIDKITIALNNNAYNSQGADFLIDDIRLYSVKPSIEADVVERCVDSKEDERRVEAKISMDFESLEALAVGDLESEETITRYYAFWEKNNDGTEWIPIKCQYNGTKEPETYFGRFTFNPQYDQNPNDTEPDLPSYQMRHKEENVTTGSLYFFTYPKATKLYSGKEYVVEFYDSEDDANNATNSAKQFDTKSSGVWNIFTVKGGFSVRIDGKPIEDGNENKIYALGQRPTITPSMEVLISAETGTKKYSGNFDFFNGSLDEYNKKEITITDKSAMSLAEIMIHFRADFPEADDPETVTIQESTPLFTQEMKEALVQRKSRFQFKKGSCAAWDPNVPTNYDPGTVIKQKLTIIPIITEEVIGNTTLICWGPYEYTLQYQGTGPTLEPGFPDVEYPDPDDPNNPQASGFRGVRIGLNDLLAIKDGNKTLTIPLQEPKWTDGEPHNNPLTLYKRPSDTGTDAYAYLVIGDYTEGDNSVSAFDKRYRIATVQSLHAESGNGAVTNNKLVLKQLQEGGLLNDGNFKFREGETYRIRVQFVEDVATEADANVAPGDLYFDLKIVPEFQTWTPTEGATSNWNNDANWKRSGKKALYKENTDPYLDNNDDPETKEAYPQTSNGFVPMYFTKVTEETANPQAELYTNSIDNRPQTLWYQPLNSDNYILDLTPDQDGGVKQDATVHIEYELMADVKTVGGTQEISFSEDFSDLSCRPYYTNTCDQIHFQPNTEMLHTEHLVYNKAWVDYELAPNRWYTLASPLKAMYAGDWYAPTEGYRQETEYFKGIEFNATTTNNRINPAVYQRSWKDGRVLSDLNNPATNYANWSIVYNNVEFPYSPGIGFSVNTVVPSSYTNNVLFRMPKEDKEYSIYNYKENETGTAETPQSVEKSEGSHGRLKIEDATNKSFTVQINHDSQGENINHTYFLVGNPFMAHLDMKKFLEANKNNVYDQKYWIISDGEQQSINLNTEDENKIAIESTVNVAPLQSFFVKATEEGLKELEVTFNTDMQVLRTTPTDGSLLRSAASPHLLTLTAGEKGKQSQARIAIRNGADDGFDDNEDSELLLDSNLGDVPAIYTVAGTQTASVNVRSHFLQIPVGVYSPDNGEVEVTVSGGENFADLSLYDAHHKTSRPLVGNEATCTLEGNSHGRYFLRGTYTATGNEELPLPDAISIYSPTRGEVIVTASAPLQSIRVYTLEGKPYEFRQNVNAEVARLTLPAGIYVIQAQTKETGETTKLIVK